MTKSVTAVLTDPAATNIPCDAWRTVDQLSIGFGNIETAETTDASALLREFHFSKLVGGIVVERSAKPGEISTRIENSQ